MAFDPNLFQGPQYSQPQLPSGQSQQQSQGGWKGFWEGLVNALKGGAKATGEFLAGSPGGYEQTPLYEPHQRNALNFTLSDAIANLQNPQQGFQPIEQEAIRNFHERTIPALSETFQGGRLSSPLFQKQLGYAGRGLESMLAAQKAQYGFDNKNQALQQLQIGLTPQISTSYLGPTPGFLQGGAEGLGKLATSYVGGKLGY